MLTMVELIQIMPWLLRIKLMALIILQLVLGNTDIGDRTYQHRPDGSNEYLTCNKCPPGTHLIAHCTKENLSAQCSPCLDGSTYTILYNTAFQCAPCTSVCVDPRKHIVNNCTVTSDTVCQCKGAGYYNVPKEDRCAKHKSCKPGEGVVTRGDHERDTQCEPCLEGQTFSPDESLTQICEPCASCPKGHKVKVKCRIDNNTQCETDDGDDGLGIGVILGIIFGGLAAFIIIMVVILLWRCDRLPCCRNNGSRKGTQNGTSPLQSDGEDEIDMGKHKPPPDPPGVVSDKILQKLAYDLMYQEYKFFFRILFIENADNEIHRVEQDHKNSGVQEQIYQLLLIWKRTNKADAKLEKIVEVLDEQNRKDLAAKYREFIDCKNESEKSPCSHKKTSNGSLPKMSNGTPEGSGSNGRHNGTKSASPPQRGSGEDSPSHSSVSADSTSPLTDSVNCTRNGGDSSIGGARSPSVGSAVSYNSQRDRVSNQNQLRTSAQSLSSRQSDV